MHIHLSAISALHIFAVVIIVGFFWRVAASSQTLRDTALGKAMAFLY